MKTEPKIYRERLRAMSGEERVKVAAELSEAVRQIAKAAVENEHPDWSPFQIQQELLRRLYGPNRCPPSGHL